MRPSFVILAILLVFVSLTVIHRHNKRSAGRSALSGSNQQTASANQTVSSAAQSNFTLGAGEHEFKIGSRKYLVYIPARYDPKVPAPLVLFFHGGGGHMEQAAADYGWEEKAETEGFIVAFPNGSSRLPRQRLATWNAETCCGYARDQKVDDVRFTQQVIADIRSRVHIDTAKIFATGMSNGGMMVHTLACTMADTFAAVASVAGTDGNADCSPSRPISVMHIHAKDDTHVIFTGGAGEDSFRDESKVTDFISVRETVERWIERNHSDPVPRRVLDVPGAYGDLYTSKENRSQVEVIVTETGGHSWPGMRPVRGKVSSAAINADDIIWDFFKAQMR